MSAPLRFFSAALAAIISLLPATVGAQQWPTKPVRFILPLGPASGVDITARLLSDRLQAKWGQPVIVENRAGGDGILAITTVLSANDDHQLLFAPTGSYTAHPYSRVSIPYNPADVIPIVRTTVTVVTVTVPASLGVNSLNDLVALAKREPGKHNWSAVTGINEYQFTAFVKAAGIDMARVPYRDLNQAVNDLGENRIQVYSSAFATVRPAVESGKLKIIALTNSRRAPMLPNVPTAREAGHPRLEFDGLVGIFGTPSVSPAIREKVSKDVIETLQDPTITQRLTATGTIVAPGIAAEFIKAIDSQKAVAAETAKYIDLKPTQ